MDTWTTRGTYSEERPLRWSDDSYGYDASMNCSMPRSRNHDGKLTMIPWATG